MTVHAKEAPETFELNAMEGAVPLQMEAEEGVAVVFGMGFTVMVISTGVPAHPLAVGVTVKVTVPGLDPDAVSVCAIELPDPADAPVAPDCETVHA